MQVAVHGGRDHKEQIGGLAVHRAVIHALGQRAGRQARGSDAVTLGMGHRNARLDGGAVLSLTGQNGRFVSPFVGNAAAPGLKLDQQVDDSFFIRGMGVKLDLGCVKQIDNAQSQIFLS